MVGRGTYWVLGNGVSLAAQRNGDGRVRIGLSFYNTAEDWFATSGSRSTTRPPPGRG